MNIHPECFDSINSKSNRSRFWIKRLICRCNFWWCRWFLCMAKSNNKLNMIWVCWMRCSLFTVRNKLANRFYKVTVWPEGINLRLVQHSKCHWCARWWSDICHRFAHSSLPKNMKTLKWLSHIGYHIYIAIRQTKKNPPITILIAPFRITFIHRVSTHQFETTMRLCVEFFFIFINKSNNETKWNDNKMRENGIDAKDCVSFDTIIYLSRSLTHSSKHLWWHFTLWSKRSEVIIILKMRKWRWIFSIYALHYIIMAIIP